MKLLLNSNRGVDITISGAAASNCFQSANFILHRAKLRRWNLFDNLSVRCQTQLDPYAALPKGRWVIRVGDVFTSVLRIAADWPRYVCGSSEVKTVSWEVDTIVMQVEAESVRA